MQKGRHLLEEYPRVGEVRMGSGARGKAWSLDKQCILRSGSSMQATGLQPLNIISAYPENMLDIVGPSQ